MQEAKDLIARLLAKRLSRLDPLNPHGGNDSFSQFQPVSASFSQFQPVSASHGALFMYCKESKRTNDVGRSVGSSLDCSELHRNLSCIKTLTQQLSRSFCQVDRTGTARQCSVSTKERMPSDCNNPMAASCDSSSGLSP